MTFQHPVLLLLLFFPILYVIWYKKKGNKNEGTLNISSKNIISKKMRYDGKIKNNILQYSFLLILILAITGIARPRSTDVLIENSINVIDILLVIDISSSMLADDFQPNRLEAVKLTASNFIKKRVNDRIGILVFAGESFIQCPLTTDKKVLLSLVNCLLYTSPSPRDCQ